MTTRPIASHRSLQLYNVYSIILWSLFWGVWDEFSEHTEWVLRQGVLKGQSGCRKQMVLTPLANYSSIFLRKQEKRWKSEAERNGGREGGSAGSDEDITCVWGEGAVICFGFCFTAFFVLLVNIPMILLTERGGGGDSGGGLIISIRDVCPWHTYCK